MLLLILSSSIFPLFATSPRRNGIGLSTTIGANFRGLTLYEAFLCIANKLCIFPLRKEKCVGSVWCPLVLSQLLNYCIIFIMSCFIGIFQHRHRKPTHFLHIIPAPVFEIKLAHICEIKSGI